MKGGQRNYLTPCEIRMVELVAEGYCNKEIAAITHLSVSTVKNQLRAAYRATGCDSRVRLALWVVERRGRSAA